MNEKDFSAMMAPHQGHKVAFAVKKTPGLEQQKIDLENVLSVTCKDCNVVVYKRPEGEKENEKAL